MKSHGKTPAVQHPGEEILNLYYSLQVEQVWDEETGTLKYDWDGYFLKVDTIINTLKDGGRQDLVDYITRNYTDLERLRWEVSREWFIPYNRKSEVVIAQFSKEEQKIIREYLSATPVRRQALQEYVGEDGQKLISKYQQMNRQAGVNLRTLSPELDAWLLFFDRVDTVRTDEAQRLYEEYKKEWGLPL
jgi:hypothetical protein